ncbi:ankyrin repeat-containing domain protein [Aspergillus undulatus]|uniref:ankyrin repeat-containing domain protein n=1 Tax=Aspergillus undulatus TaxID=1810928 RepID=UPI003CCE04AF
MKQTTLLSLPTEIIFEIASQLDYESELNALSQVNHRFYEILNPLLYRVDPNCCEQTKSASSSASSHRRREGNGYENLVEPLYSHNSYNEAWWTSMWMCAGRPFKRETLVALSRIYGGFLGRPWHKQPVMGMNRLSGYVAAAAAGHLSIVELLVDVGADISFFDRCLDFAACRGHTDVVRYLIERAVAVNYQDPRDEGTSPILNAARNGHVNIIRCLLDYGAGWDDPGCGMRALRAATQSNCNEAVVLLARHFDLPRAAKSVPDQTVVVCAAAGSGLADMLEEVISLGWDAKSPLTPVFADIGDMDSTPLALASGHGHVKIVRRLLSLGADVNGGRVRNNGDDKNAAIVSPLFEASRNGHGEIVSVLLDHGADTRLILDYKKVLCEAVPNEIVFKLLVEKGRALEHRPDYETHDAMREAIRQDKAAETRENRLAALLALSNKAVLDILLHAGYAPELGKANEDDIVRCAVSHANIPLLQHLISRGFAKLHSPSPEWQAALIRQALNIWCPKVITPTSAEDLLDFLLQQGFDIDALNDKGETPLLNLVQHSHAQRSVRLLIERGANPYFQCARGECPLVAAARKKKCACGELSRVYLVGSTVIEQDTCEILL